MKDSLKDRRLQEQLRERAQKSMEILDADVKNYMRIYDQMTSLQDSLGDDVWGNLSSKDSRKYSRSGIESRLDKSQLPFESKMIIRDAISFYKKIQRKNYN